MNAATETLLQVACPACLKANRLPAARAGEGPRCGACGAALLEGRPIELDEAAFDAFLSRTTMPVVVDFWAPWCGPCRYMAPVFERAAAQYASRARFVKVNTDLAQSLAARHGVRAIPTLAVFANGTERARHAGALDARGFSAWLEQALG